MSGGGEIAEGLAHARRLAAKGEDEPAKAAYLDVLRRDPTHFAALNELGALAYGSGHRSAARSCYEQAVRSHPGNPVGRINLANLLYDEGDLAGAQTQYEAALAADGEFAAAHQGLARVLSELGEREAAAPHWQQGFAGHALVERPYRGTANPVRLLLLVSAKGGNIPTGQWLDDRVFAVAALYTEFYDEVRALPPHDVVLNAIGDADLCSEALTGADAVLAHVTAPLINPPAQVGFMFDGKIWGLACWNDTRILSINKSAFQAAGIPILAPGTVAEILTLGLHAVALSRFSGCWVALKLVAPLCDSAETVDVALEPEARLPVVEVDGVRVEHVIRVDAEPAGAGD